jgi:hypothetical protein
VTLKIYDIKGSEIAGLVNGVVDAGSYKYYWNADPSLSSGIYFCRIQSGSFNMVRKLILVK